MKWTYCKDKKPANYEDLIFCTNEYDEQFVYCGYYSNGFWYAVNGTEFVFDSETTIYAFAYLPDPAPLPEEVL